MKFLILSQYFFPETGAASTRLAAIARELVRNGHSVQVVTGLPNYPYERIFPEYRGRVWMHEEWEGIPVYRSWLYAAMGSGVKRVLNYGSFAATSLFSLTGVARPDWIFVNSPPATVAFPGLLMARWFRARLIVNVSDLWPDSICDLGIVRNRRLLRWMERFERSMYAHADRVNALTEGIQRTLIEVKSVPAGKVTFMPNGVDTETNRPMPPDAALKASLGLSGKRVAVYAGNHGYAHALEQVLYAAKELRNRSDVHFLFIGGGSEKRKLVRLAQDLQLHNVTFHDPVPANEVPRYLSIAFCGLVPQRDLAVYRTTNRPAKLMPLMAAGKPVIFAGEGETIDLLKAAQAGFVVPSEDSGALANAVGVLADNESLCERMGAGGRQYVERNLTWSRVVRAWLEQLREPTISVTGTVVPAA